VNLLTIASLTLREAARRRVLAAVALLTLVTIGLTAWGFAKLHGAMLLRGDQTFVLGSFAILVLLIGYMFSVVLGIGAAFVAAPAIGSDVESGVVLAMLPRPIRRSDFVIGKWIALVAGGIELALVYVISGYAPPHPLRALAFMSAEGVVLVTLALALGTRLPPIAAGIVAIVFFGVTWVAGVAQSIAIALHNDGVVHATTIVSLLLPTDALWRGAAFALEPAAIAAAAMTDVTRESPFLVGAPPPAAYIWWTLGWLAAVLAAAVVSFNRRDL
jgi:ABC-type transport system involved in multi-copper enzyme maturation permease subunit